MSFLKVDSTKSIGRFDHDSSFNRFDPVTLPRRRRRRRRRTTTTGRRRTTTTTRRTTTLRRRRRPEGPKGGPKGLILEGPLNF